jgi:hypothetical protein
MSIELARQTLPNETQIMNDLKLVAKGTKSGSYAPATPELFCYEVTNDTIRMPIVYAQNKFGIKLKDRESISYEMGVRNFREGQKEVFEEAVKILHEKNSVFLQLNCSYGKTWLSINILAEMKQRTLILIHRTFLARQFLKEGEGLIPGKMQYIEDSEVDENTPGSVFICTEIRANKLPESFRRTINFVIVDEAKYFCTPTRVKALLQFKPKYTMGLCAERERKDGFNTALDMFFGPVIFRKSIKPFTVWKYFTDFTPKCVRPAYGKAKIDWNIAMQSLATNEERNEFIVALCQLRRSDKIMVLVQFKHHVEKLRDMLLARGESVNTFYGSKDKFKNCRILIATYSKAEIGFDDSNLCENFDGERLNLMILGAFYKKEIEQSVGRVFRGENPEVFDLVDNLPTLKKHSQVRDKWYRSHNGRIMPPEFIFDFKKA